MSKGTISLLAVGIFILCLVGGTLTTYNGLVAKMNQFQLLGVTFKLSTNVELT